MSDGIRRETQRRYTERIDKMGEINTTDRAKQIVGTLIGIEIVDELKKRLKRIDDAKTATPKPYRLKNGDEFESYDAALEAYGWGAISSRQLDSARRYFDKQAGTGPHSQEQYETYVKAIKICDEILQQLISNSNEKEDEKHGI